jgi:cell division protein FtsB
VALKPRTARRALAAGLLLVAAYYAVFGGDYSLLDMIRLRREQQTTEQRLAAVRAETDLLRRQADRLETQDTTVERIAREQFGMVKEGELLYRFAPAEPAKTPVTP